MRWMPRSVIEDQENLEWDSILAAMQLDFQNKVVIEPILENGKSVSGLVLESSGFVA